MARRRIEPQVKEAVLQALRDGTVSIQQLSVQYNVSVPTIYNWRKQLPTETSVLETI